MPATRAVLFAAGVSWKVPQADSRPSWSLHFICCTLKAPGIPVFSGPPEDGKQMLSFDVPRPPSFDA